MDSEDIDQLHFSHQKITALLDNVLDATNRDKIVTEYVKTCKNSTIDEFPKGLEWFNVSEPLFFFKHLKGKLVILDFFTYCCINCMHILPDLKAIEHEFSIEDGLVVIGVHSAKFDNEKLSSNILSAVQRYNISHPVVNDSDAVIWNNCRINCWPSLLIVSPKGNPIILLLGEGHREDLRLYVRNALNYYKSRNEISSHALPMKSAFHLLPESKGPLLFPGKITSYVDPHNSNYNKIAISDTGNHRIIIALPDGSLLHNIGGTEGYKDGSFTEARFNAPQGLTFQNEHLLFVADTENHLIRKIDLNLGIVETVAGIGVQGLDRTGGKKGTEQEISSPWDVCIFKTPDMDLSFHLPNENVIEKNVLIIAMAGTHQIWALFLDDTIWWKFKKHAKGTCICIAGSGREENRNNSYPNSAAFAQPSGLALSKEKKELYIADSESSSIRRLSLVDGKVTAVAGGDKSPTNLFCFGDKDGRLCEAKLQHPLGVAVSKDEQFLFIADTYNHKIKRVELSTNTTTTIRWTAPGRSDEFTFNEPSGLCFSEHKNKLYVADTNSHCIKIIDLSSELNARDVNKLNLKFNKIINPVQFDKSRYNILTGTTMILNNEGGRINLGLKCIFMDNTELTVNAPQKWAVVCPNELWNCVPQSGTDINILDTVIITHGTSLQSTFYILYNFVICKDDKCMPKNLAVEFTVNFINGGPKKISEDLTLYTGLTDLIKDKN